MNINDAVAYLMPHELTNDTGALMLTAGKMREAVGAMTDRITALEALALELAGISDAAKAFLESLKAYRQRPDDEPGVDTDQRIVCIEDLEDELFATVQSRLVALASPVLAELRAKAGGDGAVVPADDLTRYRALTDAMNAVAHLIDPNSDPQWPISPAAVAIHKLIQQTETYKAAITKERKATLRCPPRSWS